MNKSKFIELILNELEGMNSGTIDVNGAEFRFNTHDKETVSISMTKNYIRVERTKEIGF